MSLKSMTAFGSSEVIVGTVRYRVEVRTLNARFLEASIRLPRQLLALEPMLLNVTKKRLCRGKVEVVIDLKGSWATEAPVIDQRLLQHYVRGFGVIQKTLQDEGILGSMPLPNAVDFLSLAGVLTLKEEAEGAERHREQIVDALERALEQVSLERAKEGEALKAVLESYLDEIESDRLSIETKAQALRQSFFPDYRQRLIKLSESLGLSLNLALDDERLIKELLIMTEKIDVAEELERLKIHVAECRNHLSSHTEVGRRLDFLCQELNREVNTLGNKLPGVKTQHLIINLKQNIERLRQQVQNIE